MNKYMRKSMKTGCYDNTGQKRKHLDTWTVNKCRTCTCRVSTWAQTVVLLKRTYIGSACCPVHLFCIIKYCLNKLSKHTVLLGINWSYFISFIKYVLKVCNMFC